MCEGGCQDNRDHHQQTDNDEWQPGLEKTTPAEREKGWGVGEGGKGEGVRREWGNGRGKEGGGEKGHEWGKEVNKL